MLDSQSQCLTLTPLVPYLNSGHYPLRETGLTGDANIIVSFYSYLWLVYQPRITCLLVCACLRVCADSYVSLWILMYLSGELRISLDSYISLWIVMYLSG